MSNDTVFWIFDPCVLFKTEFTLIFNKEMSLEEKANAATRIFLVIILIMFLLRVRNLYLYFFIGLIIIITVYLIRYNTMSENFSPCFTDVDINNLSTSLYVPPPVRSNRFNEPIPIINPSHDIDDWKQSSLVQHSGVNKSRNGFRIKGSGYIPYESTDYAYPTPGYIGSKTEQRLPYRRQVIPNEHPSCTVPVPEPCTSTSSIPVYHADGRGHNHGVVHGLTDGVTHGANRDTIGVTHGHYGHGYGAVHGYGHGSQHGYGHYHNIDDAIPLQPSRATAGDLIEHCGYEPAKGRLAGMPHNQPISINDYDPNLTEYHKNINTQIIDPSEHGGAYTTTEVHEPQVANMGISFQQQFQPIAIDVDDRGNIIYSRKDPRTYTPVEYAYDYGEITPDSIYDPRSDGYGDHRRTYLDEVTGQPRFYYDDVNAGREMNYITRNKIDVYNFANQTGIFDKEVDCNPLENVRIQAQEAFITHGNDHRLSMQQSLMRKANERTRQQRLAPLRRDVPTRLMK